MPFSLTDVAILCNQQAPQPEGSARNVHRLFVCRSSQVMCLFSGLIKRILPTGLGKRRRKDMEGGERGDGWGGVDGRRI